MGGSRLWRGIGGGPCSAVTCKWRGPGKGPYIQDMGITLSVGGSCFMLHASWYADLAYHAPFGDILGHSWRWPDRGGRRCCCVYEEAPRDEAQCDPWFRGRRHRSAGAPGACPCLKIDITGSSAHSSSTSHLMGRDHAHPIPS